MRSMLLFFALLLFFEWWCCSSFFVRPLLLLMIMFLLLYSPFYIRLNDVRPLFVCALNVVLFPPFAGILFLFCREKPMKMKCLAQYFNIICYCSHFMHILFCIFYGYANVYVCVCAISFNHPSIIEWLLVTLVSNYTKMFQSLFTLTSDAIVAITNTSVILYISKLKMRVEWQIIPTFFIMCSSSLFFIWMKRNCMVSI